MHILKTTILGNPNVGLYGLATDTYCLLGYEVPEHIKEKIEEVLKVPTNYVRIAGTSMVGAFLAANNNMLLVPSIAFDDEIEYLKTLEIPFTIIETKLTALGNNILCNDQGCLVNPDFSANIKKRIRQALNLRVVPGRIADVDTVGSAAVLNTMGMVVHHDTTDTEAGKLKEMFDLPVAIGSVNMGNAFLRSGVIVNTNGMVVGNTTTGPELQNLDENLGFLQY